MTGAAGSALVWVTFYWVFAVAFVALIVANQTLPLPQVQLRDDERAGGWAAYRELQPGETYEPFVPAAATVPEFTVRSVTIGIIMVIFLLLLMAGEVGRLFGDLHGTRS